MVSTVWKFQNVNIIQDLREINFRDFRKPKIALFAILGAPKFDFDKFVENL